MRPLILDVATVIGLIVMMLVAVSVLIMIVGLFVDAWRQRRKVYVPRSWVAAEQEERRDCRRRPARREDHR